MCNVCIDYACRKLTSIDTQANNSNNDSLPDDESLNSTVCQLSSMDTNDDSICSATNNDPGGPDGLQYDTRRRIS